MPDPYAFAKGHGTENDFVILPDLDGTLHDLPAAAWADRVRALCDRRAGLGGDGILRVLRRDGRWFMDYWNSDGSVSEMCGNGIRVYAQYLLEEGLAAFDEPVGIDTRGGTKTLTWAENSFTVDMGPARLLGETKIEVDGHPYAATHVDIGNPHAVVVVEDLAEAGPLLVEPSYDHGVYPHGVNVEFVVRRAPHRIAMRVHERGSGETRSCGTGACAAVLVIAAVDGAPAGTTYDVSVPGGELSVTTGERMLLTGPAVIVARGTTSL